MTNKTVLSDAELAKLLVDEGVVDGVTTYDLRIARTAMQAVLQSPEIQQLRKDAERYRWLLGNYAFGDGYKRVDYALNSGEAEALLNDAIDEAMELEP